MELEALVPAALGGVLIGLSASGMLMLHGKVAGISGMLYGIVKPIPREISWRVVFLLGLVSAGGLAALLKPELVVPDIDRSLAAIGIAGLLVGFGTRLGGGCTSGHAICGVGSLSKRSLVAMLMFVLAGALTVLFVRTVLGGVL